MLDSNHEPLRAPKPLIWIAGATFIVVSIVLYLGKFWQQDRNDFAARGLDTLVDFSCRKLGVNRCCDELKKYRLFTGSPGGHFRTLGEKLDVAPDVVIHDSKGSPENARRVAGGTAALGFVENDVLRNDPWFAQRLIPVAPIDLEVLQIVVSLSAISAMNDWSPDCDVLERIAACLRREPVEDCNTEQFRLRLADKCTIRLLEHSTVYAGPEGSGTKVLAQHVFAAKNIDVNLHSADTFKDQFDAVRNGAGVSVAFMVQQDWNRRIPGGLGIEVGPELVSILDKQHGARYQPATTTVGTRTLSTVGAFAWLVTSPDVPPWILHRVLSSMSKAYRPEPNVHGDEKLRAADALAEYAEAQAQRANKEQQQTGRAAIEWIGQSLALTLPFALFVSYAWSYWKRLIHMDRLSKERLDLTKLQSSNSTDGAAQMEQMIKKADDGLACAREDILRGAMGLSHGALVLDAYKEFKVECEKFVSSASCRVRLEAMGIAPSEQMRAGETNPDTPASEPVNTMASD